jgi:hypothetical protein
MLGNLDSNWWQGQAIFCFPTVSKLASRSIKLSPHCVSGVKQLGPEADYLHPSSARLMNAWSYASTPHCIMPN